MIFVLIFYEYNNHIFYIFNHPIAYYYFFYSPIIYHLNDAQSQKLLYIHVDKENDIIFPFNVINQSKFGTSLLQNYLPKTAESQYRRF